MARLLNQYFCFFLRKYLALQPSIIYEDNHLLVIHKPPGWLVQGDKTGDRTLTDWGKDYIKKVYNKPGEVFLHPTHRLDRPVSGLVTMARTSKALDRMNKLFREDEIKKTYLAQVSDSPERIADTLVHWLIKDQARNFVKAYSQRKPDGKRAELSYELLQKVKGVSILKVYPKTGRPHQIRVQLANIGCPIVGDLRYGNGDPNPDKSISLHAYELSFIHPVRKTPLSLTCAPKGPVWAELRHYLDELDR